MISNLIKTVFVNTRWEDSFSRFNDVSQNFKFLFYTKSVERCNQHNSSFKLEHRKNDRKLSEHICTPKTKWIILPIRDCKKSEAIYTGKTCRPTLFV